MKLTNVRCRVPRSPHGWLDAVATGLHETLAGNDDPGYPIRFAIVAGEGTHAVVEATIVSPAPDDRWTAVFSTIEIAAPRRRRHAAEPFVVLQVVPTGIRCAFGGYAGDACPATNLLAAAADFVVTHPNAVNASELNEMASNVLYVEGKALDDLMLGHVGLRRVRQNRIGTFVDAAAEATTAPVVAALDAARAAGGINCTTYTTLTRPLGGRVEWSPSGCAVGTIDDPAAMFEGVARLLADGVDAIAGVSVIGGVAADTFARYQRGELPNPSGGVEAIITHLVSKVFRVPTAHAPLPYYERPLLRGGDPRAAAEIISTPHLVSVLKGLHRAPRIESLTALPDAATDLITLNNVGAVVVPAGALGGIPALAAADSNIPIVAVRGNDSVLAVTREALDLPQVIEAESYAEAAGFVLALREGISLESLRRPLPSACPI